MNGFIPNSKATDRRRRPHSYPSGGRIMVSRGQIKATCYAPAGKLASIPARPSGLQVTSFTRPFSFPRRPKCIGKPRRRHRSTNSRQTPANNDTHNAPDGHANPPRQPPNVGAFFRRTTRRQRIVALSSGEISTSGVAIARTTRNPPRRDDHNPLRNHRTGRT